MQDERATKIVEAIEMFLNDRKGFHVDCLEDDIRNEFLGDLREVVQGKLTASPAEIRKGDRPERLLRPYRTEDTQFATYRDFYLCTDADALFAKLEARIAELESNQ